MVNKQRESFIKKKYNITQIDYERIKEEQNHVCQICKSPYPSSTRKNISFMIDHCHTSGHVRGLLCYHCNLALGHFRDNIHYLENAIKYLQQDKKKFYIYRDKPLVMLPIARPESDKFNEHHYIYSQNIKINKNAKGITKNVAAVCGVDD